MQVAVFNATGSSAFSQKVTFRTAASATAQATTRVAPSADVVRGTLTAMSRSARLRIHTPRG